MAEHPQLISSNMENWPLGTSIVSLLGVGQGGSCCHRNPSYKHIALLDMLMLAPFLSL